MKKAIIIGAGPAGLTAAYKLLQKSKEIKPIIYECSNDIGGISKTVEYNGISITIIDTAGIRSHTTNTIEKIGQERSKSSIETADIILWVIDSSIDFDDNDKQISDLLKNKQEKICYFYKNILQKQRIS